MHRRPLALALSATLLAAHQPATAQLSPESAAFSLKPRAGLRMMRSAFPVRSSRARMDRLDLAPVDDRADMVKIMLRRQKQSVSTAMLAEPLPGFAPRSRMVLLTVQDQMPLSGTLTAVLGFQGMKLSNRSANVTATGRDGRLRVRDWFLPQGTLAFTPRSDLILSLGYRENMRGFGETGRSGPLGLAHEDFRALARRLQPERISRTRFDADWQASSDLGFAVTAYRGRISDRLSFAERSALPLNGGSTQLHGVSIRLRHRLTPNWHWGLRYSEARLDHGADHGAREHSLAIETGWTGGPLRATLRGTRDSLPAFASDARTSPRRFRIEADMRYQSPEVPLAITLRLTDPDRLASTALLSDAPSGSILAAEQARKLMLGAEFLW